MTQIAFILAAMFTLGTIAVLASGRAGALTSTPAGAPPLAIPETGPLVARDLREVQFAVTARGYRMEQVDSLLDRLAGELAWRDARIEELGARGKGTSGNRE